MIAAVMDVIFFFLHKIFFSDNDVAIINTILNDILKLTYICLNMNMDLYNKLQKNVDCSNVCKQ